MMIVLYIFFPYFPLKQLQDPLNWNPPVFKEEHRSAFLWEKLNVATAIKGCTVVVDGAIYQMS